MEERCCRTGWDEDGQWQQRPFAPNPVLWHQRNEDKLKWQLKLVSWNRGNDSVFITLFPLWIQLAVCKLTLSFTEKRHGETEPGRTRREHFMHQGLCSLIVSKLALWRVTIVNKYCMHYVSFRKYIYEYFNSNYHNFIFNYKMFLGLGK